MTSGRPLLPGILTLLLLLAGCVDIPNTYAPPIERRPVTGYRESLPGVIGMNDPDADEHIVRDISRTVESGAWRWTSKRPELRFALSRTKGVKLVVDFAVSRETFAATGPVTISFFVNGRLVEAVRCAEPGNRHFEKHIPQDWLRSDGMTTVAAEIDKLYKSPKDGVELGFILSRIGFTQ
ncbi:MAG: hypothetical protein IT159_12615 [Bryobacterales bacterium]|nr:hypothetical protein [Bryobacterales bacterium]